MKDKEVLKWCEKRLGRSIRKAEDFYLFLKVHCKYRYYKNKKYNQEQALREAVDGKGINCADSNEWLVKPVLRALGYTFQLIHTIVVCNDREKYGHYYLRITGKRFYRKIFDYVSATKTARAFGNPCCIGNTKLTAIKEKIIVSGVVP